MKTQFILDTNAYRQIAQDKYDGEIMGLADQMKYREHSLNARSLMSVVVSMELLKHFDETNPHFVSCFKGLCLQYFHTQVERPDSPNLKIDFIPPINPILANHFFSEGSEYLKHYFRTIEIIENATRNAEREDYKPDIPDIQKIREQLIHERTEIKNNFEKFISELNSGTVDWGYFQKDKIARKKMFEDIQSGRMLDVLAEAQIIRTHAILEKEYPQPNLKLKATDFRQYYEPILKVNQLLIEKMLQGVIALADASNPKWNSLHDSYLVAAACYLSYKERHADVKVIIVTDDKAVNEICTGTYLESHVWKVRDYLAFIYQ